MNATDKLFKCLLILSSYVISSTCVYYKKKHLQCFRWLLRFKEWQWNLSRQRSGDTGLREFALWYSITLSFSGTWPHHLIITIIGTLSHCTVSLVVFSCFQCIRWRCWVSTRATMIDMWWRSRRLSNLVSNHDWDLISYDPGSSHTLTGVLTNQAQGPHSLGLGSSHTMTEVLTHNDSVLTSHVRQTIMNCCV